MREANEPREMIENYLRQVRSGLRGLAENEATEILRELRSHIEERAQVAGAVTRTSVEAALESLGRPGNLARMYRTEDLAARAVASRSPWLVLRTVFLWAFLSIGGFIVFTFSLTGYLMGIDFVLSAVLRPFFPSNMGIWLGRNPFAFEMGAHWPPPRGTVQMHGWWVSAVLLIVGVGFLFITHTLTLACIRRFRRLRVTYA